jgi:hypothetical protein
VLPALARVQPDAAVKLARLAEQARSWAQPRRAAAADQLERAVEIGEGGEWLPIEPLLRASSAARHVLLAAWLARQPGGEPPSRLHVERAADLAASGTTGRRLSVPGRRVLFRDRDALWLGPAPGPAFPDPLECWLEPPEALEVPQRDLGFHWQLLEGGLAGTTGWPVPPGARVRVRSPAPGDAIVRESGESRPLAVLFQREGWSRRQRARALVVEHEGRVVWVPGLVRATPADELRHGWKLVAGRLSTPGDSC